MFQLLFWFLRILSTHGLGIFQDRLLLAINGLSLTEFLVFRVYDFQFYIVWINVVLEGAFFFRWQFFYLLPFPWQPLLYILVCFLRRIKYINHMFYKCYAPCSISFEFPNTKHWFYRFCLNDSASMKLGGGHRALLFSVRASAFEISVNRGDNQIWKQRIIANICSGSAQARAACPHKSKVLREEVGTATLQSCCVSVHRAVTREADTDPTPEHPMGGVPVESERQREREIWRDWPGPRTP